MTTEQINEIIFENIEKKLGPKMTFKKETTSGVTYTWGYGILNQSDVEVIVSVSKVYGLTFVIREREKCIDVEIYKAY
jgi:hypothetical protein